MHFISVNGGHPSQQKSARFVLARMHPRVELPSTPHGEGFFETLLKAITRVARMDPQISQGVNTSPSQSVTGNGKAQMHSFWSRRFLGGSHFSNFGKSIESMCQKKVDVVQNRQFFACQKWPFVHRIC